MDRRERSDTRLHCAADVPFVMERQLHNDFDMWTLHGVSPGIVTMKCCEAFGRTKTFFGRPFCINMRVGENERSWLYKAKDGSSLHRFVRLCNIWRF